MFFDILSNACSSKGYKLTPFIKSLGLSESAIARWRSGTIPNGDVLCKLADALGCSVDYLLGRNKKAAPIQMDEGGSNIMLLAGRDGQQIKIQLSDEQYDMVYKMFCSFPDADNPEL